jgi:hypothetical protein
MAREVFMDTRILVIAITLSVATACSTDETVAAPVDGTSPMSGGAAGASGSAGTGGNGTGNSAGIGGNATGGSVGSGGAGGSGGSQANNCTRAGGICECACGSGTVATPALANTCPQPCPGCGRCSDQCCVPSPIVCGTATCTVNQICVHPCSGTPPEPPPRCVDIPSSCNGTVSCGCLSNVCGGAGTCTISLPEGREVTCQGCA